MFGQRLENQDTVNGFVLVEVINNFEQFVLGHIGRQNDLLDSDPYGVAALECSALICKVIFPFADTKYRESGQDAKFAQLRNFSLQFLVKCGSDRRALEQFSHL